LQTTHPASACGPLTEFWGAEGGRSEFFRSRMIRQGLAASVAFRIDAVLLAIGIIAFADGLRVVLEVDLVFKASRRTYSSIDSMKRID
jgi:hypothetical protein